MERTVQTVRADRRVKWEKEKKHIRRSDRTNLWISRVIIWIVLAATAFPTIWVVMSSFSAGDSFFMDSLFPKQINLNNYINLFKETDFTKWVTNSLILCTTVALIQLFLTATSAYAFSRMRFKFRKYGLMGLLILQVFPASMSISAFYVILSKLNLLDNMFVLILILAGGSAYSIWLLKSYIDGLPKELDEAAFVDGATHWQVFTRIILPLSVPMMVVIFLFSFIGTYSEYMISSTLLQSPDNYTLALGLQTFINNQFSAHWTMFSSASVLASLPVMIVFMLLQKYIQSGLAAGAVKG